MKSPPEVMSPAAEEKNATLSLVAAGPLLHVDHARRWRMVDDPTTTVPVPRLEVRHVDDDVGPMRTATEPETRDEREDRTEP